MRATDMRQHVSTGIKAFRGGIIRPGGRTTAGDGRAQVAACGKRAGWEAMAGSVAVSLPKIQMLLGEVPGRQDVDIWIDLDIFCAGNSAV